ncbi:lysylphosphatidylglycerol synthase domain-containing protein [Paenibacillus sp.]|uniref:lysylphosphatidylglycerol synthase domain-containing protein n=1 Tax=Paenibacillus sp. TaxID=58172 RepID=UPI0028111CD6|nr:lysylphosphatidylglycerol synthase domain-containing protein [Paenibacillus sp.]
MKIRILLRIFQAAGIAAFAWLLWAHLDPMLLTDAWRALSARPELPLAMTAAYAAAFGLRAVAWRLYLPKTMRPRVSLLYHGLIYSLLLNHVLPVKAGDVARVGVLWRRGGVPGALALQSVAAMRALDLAALALFAAAGAPLLLGAGAATPAYVTAAAVLAVAAAGALALRRAHKLPWPAARRQAGYAREALRGSRGAAIAALVLASWALEAAVVWGVASAVAAVPGALAPFEALWANAFTIAGGPAYVGPGGIGGYESAMSYALSRAGLSASDAFAVALLSHGYKFAFSYAAGLLTMLLLPVPLPEWREWFARRKETDPWIE